MKHIIYKHKIDQLKYPFIYTYPDALYFDIETTGLSPEYNMVYLIGFSHIEEDNICIQLLLAENYEDEAAVLKAFADFLSHKSQIVTYNGSTFDLPFISKRMVKNNIRSSFENIEHLDLCKAARSLKGIMNLKDCKQTSVEAFLGTLRPDDKSGGDLIDVYHRYVSSHDQKLEEMLLYHNRMDVLGMYNISSILSYNQTKTGEYRVEEIIDDKNSLKIKLNFQKPFPVPVTIIKDDNTLYLSDSTGIINCNIKKDTLKHYYSDYKNYYYLCDEGIISHKSVAIYVDPSRRRKALREECFYQKEIPYLFFSAKRGSSNPRKEYNDKNLYIPIENTSLEKEIIDQIIKAVVL